MQGPHACTIQSLCHILPKLPTLQNWEAMPCFHLLSMWPRGAELPRIAEDLLHHTHHTSHKKHGPHGTCSAGMIQLPPDQCQRPQPQCSRSTLGAPMACAVRSSHHDPGLFGTVALHVKVKFGRVSSIHCTCSDCMSPGRGSTSRLRHTETWKHMKTYENPKTNCHHCSPGVCCKEWHKHNTKALIPIHRQDRCQI